MDINKLVEAVQKFVRCVDNGEIRSFTSYTEFKGALDAPDVPIDMVMFCPACGTQHIDKPDMEPCAAGCMMAKDYGFAAMEGHHCSSGCMYMQEGSPRWTNPPHKTHECQTCKHKWRPSAEFTNGVETVELGSSDTRPPIRQDSRLTLRQIQKMVINSDYKAGERIVNKAMEKFIQPPLTQCQAGSDGDCNHAACPQKMLYSRICPLHKDREEF